MTQFLQVKELRFSDLQTFTKLSGEEALKSSSRAEIQPPRYSSSLSTNSM